MCLAGQSAYIISLCTFERTDYAVVIVIMYVAGFVFVWVIL